MHDAANARIPRPTLADIRVWNAFGLWLRGILLGVLGMVIGIALASGGTISPFVAVAAFSGGGLLAALSWRRAAAAIARAKNVEAPAPAARHSIGRSASTGLATS